MIASTPGCLYIFFSQIMLNSSTGRLEMVVGLCFGMVVGDRPMWMGWEGKSWNKRAMSQ